MGLLTVDCITHPQIESPDPAIMASPLITTIVDAFALVVYFGFARLLLGI